VDSSRKKYKINILQEDNIVHGEEIWCESWGEVHVRDAWKKYYERRVGELERLCIMCKGLGYEVV